MLLFETSWGGYWKSEPLYSHVNTKVMMWMFRSQNASSVVYDVESTLILEAGHSNNVEVINALTTPTVLTKESTRVFIFSKIGD